uniref:Carboxypeptidase Q n=1 Tax=Anopheles dirus TaxID=7168 RepID=A0A182NQN4_9DIPT
MGLKSHRLFVGNIPAGTSESELSAEFRAYGTIEFIEIKTKTNPLNDAVETFGFVTLQTEDYVVPQCIKEFQQEQFKGVYLSVSRAKESFLEKLKREREEAEAQKKSASSLDPYKKTEEKKCVEVEKTLPVLPTLSKGDDSSSESSESDSEPEEPTPNKNAYTSYEGAAASKAPKPKPEDEIVKKWNQETYIEYGKLKIVPITGKVAEVIDRTKPHQKRSQEKHLGENARIADEKRKQGLNNLKSTYESQKLAIKNALAGDSLNKKKKITFDDYEDDSAGNQKLSLFDGQDEDDDGFVGNFTLRKQMLGEEGQKLYEMQTSFQADNRFRLDARFLEEGDKAAQPKTKQAKATEKERMKQLEILSNVTGKPIIAEKRVESKNNLQMQRFDPSQHKETEKNDKPQQSVEKKTESKKAERREDDFKVSEQKFYKVSDGFSISSAPKVQSEGFSLLSLFGRANASNGDQMDVDETEEAYYEDKPLKSDARFQYESSDSEDDKQSKKKKKRDLDKKKSAAEPEGKRKAKSQAKSTEQKGPGYYTKQGIWKENFFFLPSNDGRLEGPLFGWASAGVTDNRVDTFGKRNDGSCDLPDSLLKEIHGYQPIVNKIVNKIVNGEFAGRTWDSLAELVDTFGARVAGSDQLEKAIDYVVTKMQADGLENVHTENATVPHWVRGYESAELVKPFRKNLPLLGLGSSIGTPRGGIIAEVLAVESFKEFEAIAAEQVRGKIVVFSPVWESYGRTVVYRSQAASVASRKGAVAALVRSITPFSIGSPHTGQQHYQDDVKKIPVACITVEDAQMLLRKYRRGERMEIHLEMEDRPMEPVVSRNSIGELVGTTFTNTSVVVVSGHLDSWDVGVGAMDDGGGAIISWKALTYLKAMGLRPRRTIRAILWTGEEEGLYGGAAYKEAHKAQEEKEFNFFFESDIGTFEPRGLDFVGNADAECVFREIVKLMAPLNATEFETPTDGGPDISHWTERGFPGASLLNKNEKYFWFHHSAGDSMAVEDPKNLDKCAALWTAAAYVVADLSIAMPKDVQP